MTLGGMALPTGMDRPGGMAGMDGMTPGITVGTVLGAPGTGTIPCITMPMWVFLLMVVAGECIEGTIPAAPTMPITMFGEATAAETATTTEATVQAHAETAVTAGATIRQHDRRAETTVTTMTSIPPM